MKWEPVGVRQHPSEVAGAKTLLISLLNDGGAVHIVEYPSMSGPEYKMMLRLFEPVWLGGQRVSIPILWAQGSTTLGVEQAKREAERFVADMRKALAAPNGIPTF